MSGLDSRHLTTEESTEYLSDRPEIRQLVTELMELPVSADPNSPERRRSAEIVIQLSGEITAYDAGGLFHSLRGAWSDATVLADQLDLCKGIFNPAVGLNLQIAGLLSVRANMQHAQYQVDQMNKERQPA